MNNNTLGTWIWIGVMAVLLIILRTADGGMDGLLGQAEGLFLAATSLNEGSGTVAVPIGSLWPFIVAGGILSAVVAVWRASAADAPSGVRKYLAVECQLWAKDLDA